MWKCRAWYATFSLCGKSGEDDDLLALVICSDDLLTSRFCQLSRDGSFWPTNSMKCVESVDL